MFFSSPPLLRVLCVVHAPLLTRPRVPASPVSIHSIAQTRVKTAIEKLEVMRDEFMNVEGQASTDEDMFASLRERSVEIEEAEEVAGVDEGDGEQEAAPQEEATGGGDAPASPAPAAAATNDDDGTDLFSGGGVDLFSGSSSSCGGESMAPSADVAAKADLESPDDLAERDAAKNEDEGPAMASDDDVERLNRMFGGGSE